MAAYWPPACQPSGSGAGKVISGFFFRGETSKPISGALVALYSRDDNILLEHTYTIDGGSFTLRAPKAGGRFYLHLPAAGRVYCAEVGFKKAGERFHAAARSNPVFLPREGPSDRRDKRWSDISLC